MNKKLNKIIENQNKIAVLEKETKSNMDAILNDFENNYYFEIDIKPRNQLDSKLIWLSFYLPVINSKKEMFDLDFSARVSPIKKETTLLMLLVKIT